MTSYCEKNERYGSYKVLASESRGIAKERCGEWNGTTIKTCRDESVVATTLIIAFE